MKGLVLALVALVALSSRSPASAAEDPTVDATISSLAAMGEAACAKQRQHGANAGNETSPDVAHAIEGAAQEFCACWPAQLKALRSSLSPTQLNAKLSESDLLMRYKTEVGGRCAAEHLRSDYHGNACALRFAKIRPNSEKYCQCMSEKLAQLSDSDAAALGLATHDYVSLAAEAKKKGQPLPDPPPSLKRFFADENACRGP